METVELGKRVRMVGDKANFYTKQQQGETTILPHAGFSLDKPERPQAASLEENSGLPALDLSAFPAEWLNRAWGIADAEVTAHDGSLLDKQERAWSILTAWQSELKSAATPAVATKPAKVAAVRRPTALVESPAKQRPARPSGAVPGPLMFSHQTESVMSTKPRKAEQVAKPVKKAEKSSRRIVLPMAIDDLLGIDGLAKEPAVPRIIVDFDFGALGRQRAMYHWVVEGTDKLLLIFDTRFQYSSCYVPAGTADWENAIDLTISTEGSEERYYYRCYGLVNSFDFGVFRFVYAVRAPEDDYGA